MSSSATFSGIDGEDPNCQFDLPVNNRVELESISLNPDSTCGLTTQNAFVAEKDSEVIVFSDSDDENGVMGHGVLHGNGMLDNGVNYSVDPHVVTASYQEDPGFGIGESSCLDLFNPDDESGMSLWAPFPSSTQG